MSDASRSTGTQPRSKYWCFTINNPTQEETDTLNALVSTSKASYVCWGQESGESGTFHYQGYVEFVIRRTLNTVKSLVSKRGHFEARRGTQTEAIEYCMKDGVFQEFGTRAVVEPGRRNDLERIAQLLVEGITIREIANQFPTQYIRYHNGILQLARQLQPRHFAVRYGPFPWDYPEQITSLVIWGNSGIGKSEFAKFLLPKALFISHIDQLTLYDPQEYNGIVFDDMSFAHMPREAQIHLVDWDNDRAIHVRYGTAFIPANTPKIFTANDWRIFNQNDPAIDRRITLVQLQ